MMEVGIEIYKEIVVNAVPIGIAFAMGDFIVKTFLKMALKGVVEF